MPSPYNITNIPAPRVDFIDPRTGLMAREWYRFFFNLFNLTGAGTTDTSLADLQMGPPAINEVLGELGITYDQAQLASMMAQYEQATRDIQNQLDTAPSQPQLGTLASVNADNVRLLGFSTNPSPPVPNPAPTGTLYWDGNSTLGLQMDQGVLAKLGQSQFMYVKASATITKGQLCKHTGAVGGSGVITVAPTSLGMTDGNQIAGVAAENIALNGFGFIQDSGDLRGFDTTGTSVGEVWADGDPLYYNPAYVGSFTKVKPSAPNLKSYIGEVINASAGGSGSIHINMSPGSVLGGTDSNVQFGTLADKDLIQYDSTAQYWKNVAASSISIGTATNLAGGAAGSVPYQSGAGATTFLSIGTAGQYARVNAGATAPEWASPAALTKIDDTNVTLTLGGSASTALLNAASITVGWTGTLAAARLNANVVQAVTNDTNVTGSIATQTLTLAWSGQLAVSRGGTGVSTATANYVFAGPTSGAAAAPSFRALVAGDIPALSYVSSVSATSPVASSGGLTPTISLSSGYGDTQNPYASKTANYVLAAPNGVAGVPTFRALVSGDIPALSYVSSVGATAPITSTGGLTPTIGITSAALTKVDDTNVTLTLGGSPTTALLAATSLTLGWAGQLSLTRGGTNANLTASAGSVAYSTATALALNTAGNSGDWLKSAGTSAPTWTAPAALTKTDDTNVTLTLGGSASTALLNAASITVGWTGTLAVSRGGTGTSTAFTAGSVVFANGSGAYAQNNAQFFWDNTNTRLGIGTASPATKLDVNGNISATGTVKAIAAATQDAVILQGRAGGISSYAATITPTTLTASRTVTLPDASTTVPIASQTLTFSGPTAARTITLPDANFTAARTDAANSFTGDQTLSTGSLIIGTAGKGIDFSVNAHASGMTSEVLKWYEEGTWTPTIIGSSTAGTASYTTQNGTYTRIGRMVYFQLELIWNSGTGTGNLRISGLPFTCAAANCAVSIGDIENVTMTANYHASAYVGASSTVIVLRELQAGGTASNPIAYDAAGTVRIGGCYYV